MDRIDCERLEQYFNQIPGLLMIDMEGTIFYINDQCAEYFQAKREECLGKNIMDVFPETKMMEGLKKDKPAVVFYNSVLGIGVSMHVPLYENGEKVGLAEYDMIQHSELLYDFSDSYKEFLDQELKQLAGELMTLGETKYTIKNLVGSSDLMVKLKEKIISTAKTTSTVMITGETGTGKELVAHAIHNLSSRRQERFIKVNASSFPESLIESELFGYEGGAFTGANREGRKGKFELADGGTLFIDEINQLRQDRRRRAGACRCTHNSGFQRKSRRSCQRGKVQKRPILQAQRHKPVCASSQGQDRGYRKHIKIHHRRAQCTAGQVGE